MGLLKFEAIFMINIYIYIYIERERERERGQAGTQMMYVIL